MPMKLLPLLLAIGLGAGSAWANPTGATTVSGQVTMSQQGGVLSITNSPNAIINWASFSVGERETVRFLQQSAGSSVLNRITGQDPSRILGALQSNGQVFLINPNGILFGANSQVNVSGLVASTLNITDQDFLARRNFFTAGVKAGDISNQGEISTPSGGQVVLLAANVTNTGVITSPQGEVLLAAGQSVQLADTSSPDIHVVVSAPSNQVINLGRIMAQSGKIGIYGALINQRGVLNANSAVVGAGGKIVLKASRSTLLEADSTTTATGAGQGGEVQVLGGEQVGLMGNAIVDVSGETGGGIALIGGDYQGGNAEVQNAQKTYVGKDAKVSADAIAQGDGGKVIVWGNQTAQAYGRLSARGGAQSGDGGLVETSGHDLDVSGIRVDARAPNGRNGQWLLDPLNIQVVGNGGVSSVTDVAAFATNGSGTSTIDGEVVSNAGANVVLQAKNNISFDSPILMAGAWSLTAQAGNDININASITTNGGALTLSANDNGAGSASGAGKINLNSGTLTTNGGALVKSEFTPILLATPTPPPSADICTIAPNSALCQVLHPPTASEPVKPVQQASNEVIKTIGSGGPAKDDKAADVKAADKSDTKEVASNDKTGAKNEPVKKMYCN